MKIYGVSTGDTRTQDNMDEHTTSDKKIWSERDLRPYQGKRPGISVLGFFEVPHRTIECGIVTVRFHGRDGTRDIPVYAGAFGGDTIDDVYPHPSGEYFALTCRREAIFYTLGGELITKVDGSLFPEYKYYPPSDGEEDEEDGEEEESDDEELDLDDLMFNYSVFVCYLPEGFLVGTVMLWCIYYQDFHPVGLVQHNISRSVSVLFQQLPDRIRSLPVLAEGMGESEIFLSNSPELACVDRLQTQRIEDVLCTEGEYTLLYKRWTEGELNRNVTVVRDHQIVEIPPELKGLVSQYEGLYQAHSEAGAMLKTAESLRTPEYILLYSPDSWGCLDGNILSILDRQTEEVYQLIFPFSAGMEYAHQVVVHGRRVAIMTDHDSDIPNRTEQRFSVLVPQTRPEWSPSTHSDFTPEIREHVYQSYLTLYHSTSLPPELIAHTLSFSQQ